MPHPQYPKVKMYKVLKEIAENTVTGSRSDLHFKTGGRVRDANLKEMISKQLKVDMANLESQGQMCLKTGKIKQKAVKKEKTAEQAAMAELKGLKNRFLGNALQRCLFTLAEVQEVEHHVDFNNPGAD